MEIWFKISFVICIAFGYCGCSQSMLYSPVLHMPGAPLQKQQAQVYSGATMLAETRHGANGLVPRTTFGGELGARYALSNSVTLQAKGWLGDYNRWGASASSIIALGETTGESRWAIIPCAALVAESNSIEGGGFACHLVHWFNSGGDVCPYVAVSPVYGYRGFAFDTSENGVGLLGNAGVSFLFTNAFSATVELGIIGYRNFYDDVNGFAVSPSVVLQWTL